jgi:hypothetical protein
VAVENLDVVVGEPGFAPVVAELTNGDEGSVVEVGENVCGAGGGWQVW